MLQDEYEAYRASKHEDAIVLSVDDVAAGGDRTLIYGYDLERDTIHVYLKDGEIHYVRSRGASGQRGGVADYQHGKTLPASLLSPSKRAYPARTDYVAAQRMAALGCDLCFTTFEEVELPESGFYGMVVDPYAQAI